MSAKSRSANIPLIAGLFAVVILEMIIYAVYLNISASQQAAETPATTPKPVRIESSADLDTALSELNAVTVDDSDANQLSRASSF